MPRSRRALAAETIFTLYCAHVDDLYLSMICLEHAHYLVAMQDHAQIYTASGFSCNSGLAQARLKLYTLKSMTRRGFEHTVFLVIMCDCVHSIVYLQINDNNNMTTV